jgi:hypothetical protein
VALELGNEVENYQNSQKPFRTQPWNYETFRLEYDQWRDAIRKAVPGMPFAGPDTAADVEWVERMARDSTGDVQLLTTHYYRNGQSHGSADQLLHPDPRLISVLERLRTASRQSRIPWRMCETNSFSGGGLPGVSDTLIGALWTLDYMLLLAQYGCSGVNIETGVNQLGFISSYSPIQDDGKGVNSAGAPYCGMLAFSAARRGCTELLPVELPATLQGVTAYALGNAGKISSVVLINRTEAASRISLETLGLSHHLSAMRLLAPSAASKTQITFAGASVDPEGNWSASHPEQVIATDIPLPGMSAVVLHRLRTPQSP